MGNKINKNSKKIKCKNLDSIYKHITKLLKNKNINIGFYIENQITIREPIIAMIRCKHDNFKIKIMSFPDVKVYDCNNPININNINHSFFNTTADFFYFFYPFNFQKFPLLVKYIHITKFNLIIIETVQEYYIERIRLLWALLRNNITKLPKVVIISILKYTHDNLYVWTIKKKLKNFVYFILDNKLPLYIETIPD